MTLEEQLAQLQKELAEAKQTNTGLIEQLTQAKANNNPEEIARISKELADAKALVESTNSELKVLRDSIKKTENGSELDVDKLFSETTKLVSTRIEAEYGKRVEDLSAQVANERKQREQLVLSTHRANKISAASAQLGVSSELLEAMVPAGTSQQEIDAALIKATELVKKTIKPTAASAASTNPLPNPPANAGGANQGDTSVEALLSKVGAMSPAEYAQHRQILKKAAGHRITVNPLQTQ